MTTSAYTDKLGNSWLVDDDTGVYRGKLASPAYETPLLQTVVAAPTLDEAKAAIEEYAAEYDRTNTKPAPRIMATVTAPAPAPSPAPKPTSSGGNLFLFLLAAFVLFGKKRR